MPKIVRIRRLNPPDLLGEFRPYEVTARVGTSPGTVSKLIYTGSEDLKVWLRFDTTPEELAKQEEPSSLAHVNSPKIKTEAVYNNNMKTAFYSPSSNTALTFSSVNNVLAFGDSTNDSPFSITFWYKRNTAGSSYGDVPIFKGLSSSGYSGDNTEFSVALGDTGLGLTYGDYDEYGEYTIVSYDLPIAIAGLGVSLSWNDFSSEDGMSDDDTIVVTFSM